MINENDDILINIKLKIINDINLNEENNDKNDNNKHENISIHDILL